MGSASSTHELIEIDESLLICAENIYETPLFEVKKCLYKLSNFKDYAVIQYKEQKSAKLPPTLATCVTLKAVFERDFTHQLLINRAISVRNLNHPSILRVYSSILQPGLSSLFLKVESALPCQTLLKCLGKEELVAGLYSILQALDFLHTKVSISHNNLQVGSILLDSIRKWKLGGFEFSVPFSDLDQNKIEIIECMKNRENDIKARKFSNSHPNCYDMYCFGRMVLEMLGEQHCDGYTLTTVLEKSCLHESPSQRLSAAKLLLHQEFKNSYSFSYSFLTDYMLKNDSEKLEFFKSFPTLARDIPEDLLCTNIIPLLLSPSILMDYPSKQTIGLLLTPFQDAVTKESGLVSEETFRVRLAPCIINLFKLHEVTTRLLLLCHFPSFARLLGHQALLTIVLPEVCLGLYDSNDTMVTASLSGLSHLANLLGPSPVLNHLLNLGEQLRSRGLLTVDPAVDRTTLLFTNISLGRAKPIVYSPSKSWKRCSNLFADAAPKVDRQSRDVSFSKSVKVSQRLCDVAPLSSKYLPPLAPVFQPPKPPITKLSQSRVEPKRSLTTIFASLDNSAEDLQLQSNATLSRNLTAVDHVINSDSRPEEIDDVATVNVLSSESTHFSRASTVEIDNSVSIVDNPTPVIQLETLLEELEPKVSFPAKKIEDKNINGCIDIVQKDNFIYLVDATMPTDWDDGWEDVDEHL